MYKFDGVGSSGHFKRPMDTVRPRSKSEVCTLFIFYCKVTAQFDLIFTAIFKG